MKPTKSTVFWIVIGAIMLAIYLGFSQAGWVTGGNAIQLADDASEAAVIARLAPICVGQLNQVIESEQKLAELSEIAISTQRTTYVKEQGWATMPGEATADDQVARECAKQLLLLDG